MEEGGGNTQLPCMEDFMVTPRLIRRMETVLPPKGGGGGIYFQSNAEDVAVTIEHLLIRNCAKLCPNHQPHTLHAPATHHTTIALGRGGDDGEEAQGTRHFKYLKILSSMASDQGGGGGDGGMEEGGENTPSWMRAKGPTWWSTSPFEPHAKTETEAMCQALDKPMYRMWWAP